MQEANPHQLGVQWGLPQVDQLERELDAIRHRFHPGAQPRRIGLVRLDRVRFSRNVRMGRIAPSEPERLVESPASLFQPVATVASRRSIGKLGRAASKSLPAPRAGRLLPGISDHSTKMPRLRFEGGAGRGPRMPGSCSGVALDMGLSLSGGGSAMARAANAPSMRIDSRTIVTLPAEPFVIEAAAKDHIVRRALERSGLDFPAVNPASRFDLEAGSGSAPPAHIFHSICSFRAVGRQNGQKESAPFPPAPDRERERIGRRIARSEREINPLSWRRRQEYSQTRPINLPAQLERITRVCSPDRGQVGIAAVPLERG